MSGGTFTDEKGNVYIVGPDGKLTPAGQTAGLTRQPTLQDIAKKEGADIAKNQLKKQVEGVIEGAGGQNVASSVLGNSATLNSIQPGTMVGSAANGGSLMADGVGGSIPVNVPAAGVEAPGAFSLNGIGSSGNAILPAAGLAGAYNLWGQNKQDVGTGKGYLQGAASGAAMGSYFGPWGAVAGAGIGLIGNAFGGESRTKLEEDARKKLADQGVVIPNSEIKEWENNAKFAQSRNEADLIGKDIIHAAQLYGIGGYSKLDAAKQEAIANKALELKLVREHHGTIQISPNAELEKEIQAQLGLSSAPASSGSPGRRPQGPSREVVAQAKKEKKKQILSQIMPELDAPATRAPDYGKIDVSSLMKNPYL